MKIVVIDDESLVRDSVVKSLQCIGISNIYEAKDGIEGFNQIQSIRPDLIIADIRMPGMSGIELLTKLKQTDDETPFLLLSGYDLFEYAQTALNLGAFSYLLKPISTEQLQKVILKVQDSLLQRKYNFESKLLMTIKLNQGLTWMKRHFIGELVTQKYHSVKYLCSKMSELEIIFKHDIFHVISISLDDYSKLNDILSPNGIVLIKYGIDNIASEIMSNYAFSVFSFDTEDGQGLLVNLPSEDMKNESSLLREACMEIQSCIFRFLHQEVTIAIGSQTSDLLDLSGSYEASKQALMQRLIKGGGSVICYENSDLQREKFKVISFQTEQDMLSAFEKGELDTALGIIKELYSVFLVFDFIDRSSLLKLNFQLILLIYKILERLGVLPMEIFGEELTLYEEVNECGHIDAIIEWFQDKLTVGFNAVLQARETGNKKIVEKARLYIHEHYHSDLSLEGVAEHIHISPTYFSSIFKKETNENFVDYVSNYRIDQAKQFLKEGIYKVNVIAEMTGFHNVKYFYKVFKKRTGLTPSEYKDI